MNPDSIPPTSPTDDLPVTEVPLTESDVRLLTSAVRDSINLCDRYMSECGSHHIVIACSLQINKLEQMLARLSHYL